MDLCAIKKKAEPLPPGERRQKHAILSAKKLAVEGLILLASLAAGCSGGRISNDSGHDASPRPDADAMRDGDFDSNPRPDADYPRLADNDRDIEGEADAEGVLPACPSGGCPTYRQSRPELRIDMGSEVTVGGVRIHAISNEGPVAVVNLLCNETGELISSEPLRINLNETVGASVVTADVSMQVYGIIGGRTLFMNADVVPTCSREQ